MKPEFRAPDHTGTRVSADGILDRGMPGRKMSGDEYMRAELCKHLHEFADRWYAGDLKVADECFQLYCLDQKRPPKED